MRLIDADALIKSMKSHTVEDNGLTDDYKAGLTDSIRTAVALAENASTISAVPVVRCGECRFRNTSRYDKRDMLESFCRWDRDESPNDDDYCSYGEKMESEGST